MTVYRKFTLVVAAIMMVAAPGIGTALDLGMTPSNVFALWTNVNKALVAYAPTVSDDADWLRRLAAMTPQEFQGKTPKHVMGAASRFDSSLRQLIGGRPDHLERGLFERQVLFYLGEKNPDVNPSLVYLRSAHLLGEIIEKLVDVSRDGHRVSPYFNTTDFTNKEPSDVLGQIDLAQRRLDSILEKQRAGHLAREKTAP